jgi:hypothetical protein
VEVVEAEEVSLEEQLLLVQMRLFLKLQYNLRVVVI